MRLSGWMLCPSLPVAKVVLPPAAVLRAVFLFSPFVDFPSTKQLSPTSKTATVTTALLDCPSPPPTVRSPPLPPSGPCRHHPRSHLATANSSADLRSPSASASASPSAHRPPPIAHRPPPTAHSRPRSKPFLPSCRLLDHTLPAFAVLSSPLVQIYLQHDACLGGSSPVLLVLGTNLPARRHHPLPSFSSFSSFSPSRHHSTAISPHPLLIA